MDLKEFRRQSSDQRHPWEHARFRFFQSVIDQYVEDTKAIKVLDIGGGDAWFSNELVKQLPEKTNIDCIDINYSDADIEKIQTYLDPRVRLHNHLGSEKYDMILLLDVLEHIEDDKNFLSNVIENNCHKDTVIVISVPMWQWLFSEHDVELGHFRRYSPALAKALLKNCRLTPLKRGSLFWSLFLFRTLEKAKSALFGNSQQQGLDDLQVNSFKGRIIFSVLLLDSFFSKWMSRLNIDFFGLSWWTACKIKS